MALKKFGNFNWIEMDLLRPNPEGFVFMSWKEREGGGMEGRKQ